MVQRRMSVADIKEILVWWDVGESVSAIAKRRSVRVGEPPPPARLTDPDDQPRSAGRLHVVPQPRPGRRAP